MANVTDYSISTVSANECKDSQRHVQPFIDDAATTPVLPYNRDRIGHQSNIAARRINERAEQAEQRPEKMRGPMRTRLEYIGEDPNRDGLRATPSQYAKALLF